MEGLHQRNQTTNSHLSDREGSGLNDSSNGEECTPNIDGNFATVLISCEARDDGSNERATRAEGSDQLLLAGSGDSIIERSTKVHQDG